MSVLKNIQLFWLNRRTTKLEPSILAVEAFSDAISRSYSNSTISALGSIVCHIGSHYLSLLALLSLPTVSL